MTKTSSFLAAAVSLISIVSASSPPALAQGGAGIEAGTLVCHQDGRDNYLLASKTNFACEFKPVGNRPAQKFSGSVGKLGIDLTFAKDEYLAWVVLAPSADANVSGLEGIYIGGSADAAAYYGTGAHLLVGGFEKSFALQPVSLTGETGYGASVALERFSLDYEGPA